MSNYIRHTLLVIFWKVFANNFFTTILKSKHAVMRKGSIKEEAQSFLLSFIWVFAAPFPSAETATMDPYSSPYLCLYFLLKGPFFANLGLDRRINKKLDL